MIADPIYRQLYEEWQEKAKLHPDKADVYLRLCQYVLEIVNK